MNECAYRQKTKEQVVKEEMNELEEATKKKKRWSRKERYKKELVNSLRKVASWVRKQAVVYPPGLLSTTVYKLLKLTRIRTQPLSPRKCMSHFTESSVVVLGEERRQRVYNTIYCCYAFISV